MNIVLFESSERAGPLPREDERAKHILEVLGRKVGEAFDAGIIDGPRGRATVTGVDDVGLSFQFEETDPGLELYPIDLIVGLSRPQTNRKILQEATSIGARSIHFVVTERGEPSYATSKLWTTGEWRRHLVAGAAQAFSTRLPEVRFGESLADALARVGGESGKIALDNYEAPEHLMDADAGDLSIVLAVGSERGWTSPERALLRESGFALAHLGERPLRTETAASVGLGILARRFL